MDHSPATITGDPSPAESWDFSADSLDKELLAELGDEEVQDPGLRRLQVGLLDLPDELVGHILSFCSALTVACCQRVCRRLEACGKDDLIWRSLALSRWGRSALEGHMWEGSWFELYGHLDREAVGKIRRELATSFPDNPDVREALIQRELDKRRQAPGPGATAGDGAVGTRATVRDEVRRWRARHGMLDAAPSDHTCTPRCSLDQLSVSVFICRSSGRVHRCGAHCTLAENNNQGEMVCPLTGAVVDRSWEGDLSTGPGLAGHRRGGVGSATELGGEEGAGEAEDGDWTAGPIGGLGQLFVEGYAADAETGECPFVNTESEEADPDPREDERGEP